MKKWSEIFEYSNYRLGKENNEFSEHRSEYIRDFDRIIFNESFRKLQNKTQVVPFPDTENIRNRLTHSLETSSVGRSLGKMAGEFLINKYNIKSINSAEISAVVSAACLAHDIGNPPFGHSGEESISKFFNNNRHLIDNLNFHQQNDFLNFEGNAAGFKILTNYLSHNTMLKGGMRLTYLTLASFMKYPNTSIDINKNFKHRKKYSVFNSEKEILEIIADKTFMNFEFENSRKIYYRHPFSYLVESADDICYNLIDFEDGYFMRIIDFKIIEELFINIISSNWHNNYNTYKSILSKNEKITFLRSLAINSLINNCIAVFKENEKDIFNSKFNFSLINSIEDKNIIDSLKQINMISIENLYNSENVLSTEIAGYHVLSYLLNIYTNAILNPEKHIYEYKLIPQGFKNEKLSDYDKLLNICMYISNLSDKSAINLYRKLNGIIL